MGSKEEKKKKLENVMAALVTISISSTPQSYLINGICINPGVKFTSLHKPTVFHKRGKINKKIKDFPSSLIMVSSWAPFNWINVVTIFVYSLIAKPLIPLGRGERIQLATKVLKYSYVHGNCKGPPPLPHPPPRLEFRTTYYLQYVTIDNEYSWSFC